MRFPILWAGLGVACVLSVRQPLHGCRIILHARRCRNRLPTRNFVAGQAGLINPRAGRGAEHITFGWSHFGRQRGISQHRRCSLGHARVAREAVAPRPTRWKRLWMKLCSGGSIAWCKAYRSSCAMLSWPAMGWGLHRARPFALGSGFDARG